MSDVIGGRLAGLFLGYALAAVIGGLGAFIAARPLVEREIRGLVRDADAEFAILAVRLGSRELAATIDARAAVEGTTGVEYSLRDASGTLLAGRLAPVAAPMRDGWLEFELPGSPGGRASTRPMLGRRTDVGDGFQLLVAYDIDRRMATHTPLVAWLIAGIIATPLLGALIAWLLARRSRRRVDAVTRAINRILSGDLTQRLPRVGRTELDRLTGEFNAVLERMESRSATMRAAADSTAHDLRTPLSRLRSAVELAMRREDDPPQLRAALDRVVVEVDRLQMTLDALLRISLAESGSAPLEPVDLSSIIVDVVELYRPLAEEKGQQFECTAESRLALPGNRQLLAQAIANLLDNAIKFTPRGGRVLLSAAERREGVVLEVADSGPGIAPADRGRALERSRRLENSAGKPGSGLGLSLVVAVARLHGADFVLDDNAPGLCARLVFRSV
jgi:signal transduction histidine kinase